MRKKFFFSLIVVITIVAIAAVGGVYMALYSSNIQKSGKLYIPKHATYTQFVDSLTPFLKHPERFQWAAKWKNLDRSIHSGRYTLVAGMSNNKIINLIRSGQEDAIDIRIGNYTSINEMAGRVAPYLECDSAEIVKAIIAAPFAQDIDQQDLLYFFIPNTYKFHWDMSGADFVRKMKTYFDKFWTPQRQIAAKAENMTPLQVTILASIVQLESSKPDEQPRVAGLYLNRLRIGMKLDADPTVIFAMKQHQDSTQNIQRVYYKDLKIPSPYNTYLHNGLPPGPICMPNPSAIDAVLHPAQHDYLFFVADPNHPGYHIYARTLAEQDKNARKYHRWINQVMQKKQ